jgi:hypothetical protein
MLNLVVRRETARLLKVKRGIKNIGWEGMYLTDVAPDGDKWRDVVNMVMYLQVS